MNVSLHLFIPPIGEFDAGGIDDAMSLVGALLRFFFTEGAGDNFIIYGDDVITIKGAMLAVGGASKIGEFGDGAARVWG